MCGNRASLQYAALRCGGAGAGVMDVAPSMHCLGSRPNTHKHHPAKGGHASCVHSPVCMHAHAHGMPCMQGLADEEYDVDDDDDYEDDFEGGDEDDEDGTGREQGRALGNGNGIKAQHGGHANGGHQPALPTYGYRDLFGKDFDKRRAQMIEVKVGGGSRVVCSLCRLVGATHVWGSRLRRCVCVGGDACMRQRCMHMQVHGQQRCLQGRPV